MNYVKISEAVELLGLADKTIRRWIEADKVEGEKINGIWHVDIDSARVLVSDKAKDKPSTALLESLLSEKDKQIEEKDARIADLRQQLERVTSLLAMAQSSINQLTEQNRLLIESKKEVEPLWQRIKAVFAPESV